MKLSLLVSCSLVLILSVSAAPKKKLPRPPIPNENENMKKRAPGDRMSHNLPIPNENENMGKRPSAVEGSRVARSSAAVHEQPQSMLLVVRTADEGDAYLKLHQRDSLGHVPLESASASGRTVSKKRYANHGHYVNGDNSAFISSRTVRNADGTFSKSFGGNFIHKRSAYKLEPTANGHRVTRTGHSEKTAKSRSKRQAGQEHVIEYCAVLDYSVFDTYMQKNNQDKASAIEKIKFHYTHVFNGMDLIFRNIPDIDISIRVGKFVIQEDREASKWTMMTELTELRDSKEGWKAQKTDAFKSLNMIAADAAANEFSKCDHIGLFTKTDIHSPPGSDSVIGLAVLGKNEQGTIFGACSMFPVSINEDEGFHTWITAAHELGHNLGSEHDGFGAAESCTERSFIMNPSTVHYTTENIGNSLKFSSCSGKQIVSFIDVLNTANQNCLVKSSFPSKQLHISDSQIGLKYNADEICKLQGATGACSWKYTSDAEKAEMCVSLWCEFGDQCKLRSGTRALPGSPCGAGKACTWSGECAPASGGAVTELANKIIEQPVIPEATVTETGGGDDEYANINWDDYGTTGVDDGSSDFNWSDYEVTEGDDNSWMNQGW